MSGPCLEVTFMPWAGIKNETRLGAVTLWPFCDLTAQRITDKAVRDHLDKYLRCFVDHQGHRVDSVVICSHGTPDFRESTPTEAGAMRAAVDALVFATISSTTKNAVCANNSSIGPPSADRYELITHKFSPACDRIAVQAGSVLSSGWKIGEIAFARPWSTGGSFGSPDSELLSGFSRVFDAGIPAEPEERLLRSLEWFRLAHVEYAGVSPLSKVVMMATAFEILLDVPNEPRKKGRIADGLDALCGTPESIGEERQNGGQTINHTKIGWWAWDFYTLRNCVVHGGAITTEALRYPAPDKDWLTHLIVADLVVWECVMRKLYARGFLGQSARKFTARLDAMCPDQCSPTDDAAMPMWFARHCFEEVHEALGWIRKPGSA